MKKATFLAFVVCLTAFSAFAQSKTTNFSGNWSLDVSKSKLDERARIESISMTVTQTEKDIKIETQTKRMPPPEGSNQGGGRGGFGGGDGTMTYMLDGKETTVQQETAMGAQTVKLTAKIDDGKLKLVSSRTFNTQMGEITMTTKDVWTLSEDGKTLTVKRDSETPRGTNSSEMIFSKK